MAKERDYRAEYQRRIAKAMERGKTRQQARGHKPGEHIIRKEREIKELGLTRAQIKSIRQWGYKYKNSDRNIDDVIDRAREQGYESCQQYRKIWNAARRKYLKELEDGTYINGEMPYLLALTTWAEVENYKWLYYH